MVRHVTDEAAIRTDAASGQASAASQVATLPPRPAAPLQRLTARPLSHDLDDGSWGRPAAWTAFGDGTDGSAA